MAALHPEEEEEYADQRFQLPTIHSTYKSLHFLYSWLLSLSHVFISLSVVLTGNVFSILLFDEYDCEYMVSLFLRLARANINRVQAPYKTKISSSLIKKNGKSYVYMTVVITSS